MKKLLTIKSAPNAHYNESYFYALRFALLKDDGFEKGTTEAYHWWAKCKDYFNDIFWSEETGKSVTDVYGFSWKPGTLPKKDFYLLGLDGNMLYPGVGVSNTVKEDLCLKAKNILAFLHQWEDRLKFPRTEAYPAKENRIALKFSAAWTTKPTLISLFTLLVRCSMNYEKGEPLDYLGQLTKTGNNRYCTSDGSFISDLLSTGKLQSIWTKGVCQYGQPYTFYTEAKEVHNNGGILHAS